MLSVFVINLGEFVLEDMDINRCYTLKQTIKNKLYILDPTLRITHDDMGQFTLCIYDYKHLGRSPFYETPIELSEEEKIFLRDGNNRT